MDFTAIDVETANADLASICQVGVVTFKDLKPSNTFQILVDPEDEFNPVNVSIHGIDESSVSGCGTFPVAMELLRPLLDGRIVVSHTAFDRLAMARATERYRLPAIECRWLDTARVVRRTWTQFAKSGYGLADMARWCGITFVHHKADEDARAAGMILAHAMAETGLSVEDWFVRISSEGSSSSQIKLTGNPEGPLAGEVIVFTGALAIARREAADLAASVGCDVETSVTKKTTLLVVGDQDLRCLAGHQLSSKHRKAESLILSGQPLRILGEADFIRIVDID
ncbi:MAG: exonuclease domain-containing protein [Dehalococcoidia bacterium]